MRQMPTWIAPLFAGSQWAGLSPSRTLGGPSNQASGSVSLTGDGLDLTPARSNPPLRPLPDSPVDPPPSSLKESAAPATPPPPPPAPVRQPSPGPSDRKPPAGPSSAGKAVWRPAGGNGKASGVLRSFFRSKRSLRKMQLQQQSPDGSHPASPGSVGPLAAADVAPTAGQPVASDAQQQQQPAAAFPYPSLPPGVPHSPLIETRSMPEPPRHWVVDDLVSWPHLSRARTPFSPDAAVFVLLLVPWVLMHPLWNPQNQSLSGESREPSPEQRRQPLAPGQLASGAGRLGAFEASAPSLLGGPAPPHELEHLGHRLSLQEGAAHHAQQQHEEPGVSAERAVGYLVESLGAAPTYQRRQLFVRCCLRLPEALPPPQLARTGAIEKVGSDGSEGG